MKPISKPFSAESTRVAEETVKNEQRFKQWAVKMYHRTHHLPVQKPIYLVN